MLLKFYLNIVNGSIYSKSMNKNHLLVSTSSCSSSGFKFHCCESVFENVCLHSCVRFEQGSGFGSEARYCHMLKQERM